MGSLREGWAACGGHFCSGALTARAHGNTFRPEERAIVLGDKATVHDQGPLLLITFQLIIIIPGSQSLISVTFLFVLPLV